MKKKNHPEDRPVRDWSSLLVALVQLVTAIVNAVFNYPCRHAGQMDSSVRVEARSLGFQPIT